MVLRPLRITIYGNEAPLRLLRLSIYGNEAPLRPLRQLIETL